MPETIEHPEKRSDLLTVLCILTFIGSGMSMMANGILFLTIEPVKQLLEQQSTYSFLGSEINMDFLLDISPVFFLLQSLTLLVSIIGATQMWHLKKAGFHLYTVAQILLLILPKLFVTGLPFPVLELLISASFVYLYAKGLSLIK
jgi:hypothetical protein